MVKSHRPVCLFVFFYLLKSLTKTRQHMSNFVYIHWTTCVSHYRKVKAGGNPLCTGKRGSSGQQFTIYQPPNAQPQNTGEP